MKRLKIKRVPVPLSDAVVGLDPEEVAEARQVLDELLDEYQTIAKPDHPSLAIARAETDRLYRAGLGSPEMLREMMREIRTYLQRLTRPDASGEVQNLARLAAEQHLRDVRKEQAIANILSYVVPYRKGLAASADDADQIDALRAAARAARLVDGPLRRLDAGRVAADYSARLRGIAELERNDAPAEPPPRGSSVPVSDGFMLGTIRARMLDRLDVLRDVLAGVEAAALAETTHRRGGMAARGRDVIALARQLRALRDAMAPLDPRQLASLVPSRTGDTSQAPLVALAGLLSGFAAAAKATVATLQRRMGRPKARDPLVLGVTELARLWREVYEAAPTTTNNRGGFCDMCLVLPGPDGVGFAESTVKGQARHAAQTLARADAG